MEVWIYPLIGLALFTTLGYFRGRKKNSWISSWIAKETEAALKPVDTQYTNFGGAIGYNFVYQLEKPFREAKGTFTLLPRQSILYLPLSFLIAKHDRYYLNLYVQGKLLGEGHLVSSHYNRKAQRRITGIEEMERGEAFKNNTHFFLYWKGKGMEERLRKFLDKIEQAELLLHFCCFKDNKNFFFYLIPQREKLHRILASALPELKPFFVKGVPLDDGRNEEED